MAERVCLSGTKTAIQIYIPRRVDSCQRSYLVFFMLIIVSTNYNYIKKHYWPGECGGKWEVGDGRESTTNNEDSDAQEGGTILTSL